MFFSGQQQVPAEVFQPMMFTTTNASETFTAIAEDQATVPAQGPDLEMDPETGPGTVFRPLPGPATQRMTLTIRQF